MQTHTLAATHFGDLRHREHQQFAVFTYGGDMVSLDRHDQSGDFARIDIEHLTPFACIGDHIVRADHKTAADRRGHQQFAARFVRPDFDNIRAFIQIDHQPDRITEAAPARQFRRLQREHLAVGHHHQQFGGGFGEEREFQPVIALELQARQILLVAFQRTNPAFFRHNYSQRLALDHRFGQVDICGFGWRVEGGAATADFGFLRKRLFDIADLRRNALPLGFFIAEQFVELGFLVDQIGEFLFQLHFFQTTQRAQPRVQNRLGLIVGQGEGLDQRLLGLVLLADDFDHAVEIEIDNQQTTDDFQPAFDLVQPVLRAPVQNHAAMIEPFAQGFGKAEDFGHQSGRQNVHVHRNAAFKLGELEQRFHQQDRIDGARARLEHHADIFGRFIADIGQKRQFLVIDQFGDFLDQP